MPQGPWEQYQTQTATEEGPWTKYQQKPATSEDLDAIRKVQAAKYPSSQEMGAKGQGVEVGADWKGNLSSVPTSQGYEKPNRLITNALGAYDRNIGAPLRQFANAPIDTAVSTVSSMMPTTKEKAMDVLSYGPAAPMAKGMVEPAAKQAAKGDYVGAAGDLMGTGLAAMTPQAAEGMAGTVAPVIRGTAALAGRGLHAAHNAASDAWISAKNTPKSAIGKAIKPPRSNIGFFEKLDRSLPEIKAVEPELGKPIENIDDLLDAAKIAKKNVRAQFDVIAGPERLSQIDGADIANATGNQDYFRTFSIEELENRLKDVNAQLDTYYDKFPAARRAARMGNTETSGLVAEGNAIRKTLYNALDPAGEGGAPAELQRRYGAIMDLEQETLKRKNVAARANPDSMTEQLGAVGAGMKAGKGALRMLGGDIKGGLQDMGSAATGYGTSRAIKAANTTDALIKNAFRRYGKTPAPIDFTKQPIQSIMDPYGMRRMTPQQLRGVGKPVGAAIDPATGQPVALPEIDPFTKQPIRRY